MTDATSGTTYGGTTDTTGLTWTSTTATTDISSTDGTSTGWVVSSNNYVPASPPRPKKKLTRSEKKIRKLKQKVTGLNNFSELKFRKSGKAEIRNLKRKIKNFSILR